MLKTLLASGRHAAAALVASLLCAAPARAASLEVSPVVIEAPPGQSTATLRVTNAGTSTTQVQVRGFAWSQTAAGDELAPTSELLLSPPIFAVPPGQTQVVRLLLRPRGGAEKERAFRLLIDEIPSPAAGVVNVTLRISVPAFVAAQGSAAPDLHWRTEGQGPALQLVLANTGRRRARVNELLAGLPSGQRLTPKLLETNPYVLPGGERRWTLGALARPLSSGAALQLSGKTDVGALNVALQPSR